MKRNTRNYYFIFIVFIFISNFVFSQKKLFFCPDFDNKEQIKFVKDNNIEKMYILYQYNFVTNDGTKCDTNKLRQSLNKIIPDVYEKGYAMLDWEGTTYDIVTGNIDTSKKTHTKNIYEFQNALKLAKKLRPNIKWTYYDIPRQHYSMKISKYKKATENMNLLFKELDFLAPSLYILDGRNEVSDSFTYNFIDFNTQYALELGLKYKKEVFPVIWHRYHPRSKNSGNKQIETDFFSVLLNRMINEKYNSKEIDGLIWWQCEDYLYRKNNNSKVTKDEFKNINKNNKEKYYISIFNKYIIIIKNLL